MVTGRRIRLRLVVIGSLGRVVAVVAFGLLDLSRPPEQRAHLGRLFERVGNEGLEPLVSIVQRKLVANLQVSTSSFWVLAIPRHRVLGLPRRYHPTPSWPHRRIPGAPAGLAAATVAAVLGSLRERLRRHRRWRGVHGGRRSLAYLATVRGARAG